MLLKVKYRCALCGKRIWMKGLDHKSRIAHIMKTDGLCYECAYWEELIEYPPKYMEVLNGRCIRICPPADRYDKTLILGGKGKKRYFMRNDGSVIMSNDIWNIGEIPERYIPRLPDTMREITARAYTALSRHNRKCIAKACFDRYHCFRYNMEVEADGPYNIVRDTWVVGGERCRDFLDKDKVYIDEKQC